jgi:hypothetical protein
MLAIDLKFCPARRDQYAAKKNKENSKQAVKNHSPQYLRNRSHLVPGTVELLRQRVRKRSMGIRRVACLT